MAKYLDTSTVKKNKKFYKTTFPYDMILTKDYVSTSDEKVEKLSRSFKIHYKACIRSLMYLFSTREDLRFSVLNIETFSSNPGKVHFERLSYLLRYIRENKTWGLNYYDEMKDAPLSDLLRQDSINTENRLIVFSYSIWKY